MSLTEAERSELAFIHARIKAVIHEGPSEGLTRSQMTDLRVELDQCVYRGEWKLSEKSRRTLTLFLAAEEIDPMSRYLRIMIDATARGR